MKTHFAIKEQAASESNTFEIFGDPLCGSSSETVIDKWNYVDCKRCLRLKESYKKSIAEDEKIIVKQMGEMADFMEQGTN